MLKRDTIRFDLGNKSFRTALSALISFREKTSSVEIVREPPAIQIGERKISLTFGNGEYYGDWPASHSAVLEVDSSGNIASIETIEAKNIGKYAQSLFHNYYIFLTPLKYNEEIGSGFRVELWEANKDKPHCSVFIPGARIKFDSLERNYVCTTARKIQPTAPSRP